MLTWFTFLAYAASGSLMAANAFYHGSLASGFWVGLLFASQSLILDAWVASLAWLLARSVKNRQSWMTLLWSVLFLVLGAHATYTLAYSTDAELRRARHEQPLAANGMNQPLVANAPLPPAAGPRVPRATPQGSPNQKPHLTKPTPPQRNSTQEARPSPYAFLQASLLTLVVGLGFGVCGYFERSSGRPQRTDSGVTLVLSAKPRAARPAEATLIHRPLMVRFEILLGEPILKPPSHRRPPTGKRV